MTYKVTIIQKQDGAQTLTSSALHRGRNPPVKGISKAARGGVADGLTPNFVTRMRCMEPHEHTVFSRGLHPLGSARRSNAHTTYASMTRRSLWQFRFSPCPYASRQFIGLERMGKKSASPIAAHRHHLLSAPM